MIKIFSPYGLWQDSGLFAIRIIVGIFMIYHGWEVFDSGKMKEYTKWLVELKFPSPSFMAYLGKVMELITGILVTLGLFTRIAVVCLAITMAIVCFGIGKGRIFMEDQHPFLFVLLSFVFFFTGAGKWSLDRVMFGRRG